MHTHTAKQDAIEAIERLPDNVDFDQIVYQLYVLRPQRTVCGSSSVRQRAAARSDHGVSDISARMVS